MKQIKDSRIGSNTIMALSLIPLSGFAMDVYIPSLPDMAVQLHTTPAAIQLTLSLLIPVGLDEPVNARQYKEAIHYGE